MRVALRALPQQRRPEARTVRAFTAAACILVVLALYCYPYMATFTRVGWSDLPPAFAKDLYFYLLVSDARVSPDGQALDPWYHVLGPTASVVYYQFHLPFATFRAVKLLTGANWSQAVLGWLLAWTMLICLSGWYLFRVILPEWRLTIALTCVALLMLFDFAKISSTVGAWRHLLSSGAFADFALPYQRIFFPQVAIPPLLLYVAFQISALKSHKWAYWAGMAILQFAALLTFPYATILMAAITGCVVVYLLATKSHLDFPQIVTFGMACAVIDVVTLGVLQGGFGRQGGAVFAVNMQVLASLVQGRPKLLLLLIALTATVFWLREHDRPHVTATLVALPIAIVIVYLSDFLFSPALQMAHHMKYFMHTTLAILTGYVGAAILARVGNPLRYWGVTPVFIFAVVHGWLCARGNYQTFFPLNDSVAQTTSIVASMGLDASDLVILSSELPDDMACAWPLISSAPVLYCLDAKFAMGTDNINSVQRFREALYLNFSGFTSDDLTTLLARDDGEALEKQTRLAQVEERVLLGTNRSHEALTSMRNVLGRNLQRIEDGDPQAHNFFREYARVVAIESSQRPLFSRERMAQYLETVHEEDRGPLRILMFRPRVGSGSYVSDEGRGAAGAARPAALLGLKQRSTFHVDVPRSSSQSAKHAALVSRR